jgi:hypothetical protein
MPLSAGVGSGQREVQQRVDRDREEQDVTYVIE